MLKGEKDIMSWICFEIKEKMEDSQNVDNCWNWEIGMVEFGTLVYIFTCLEICLITKSVCESEDNEKGEMM